MADVKASGAKLVMLLMKESLNEISIDVADAIQMKNKQGKAAISTLSTIGNLSRFLNTDVELIKVKPDSIFFVLGKTFSKKVFVKPRVQVNYDNPEVITRKIKTFPPFVTISSDSLTLIKIDTLYTEKIVLNDLNKNIEQAATIELPEELNNLAVLSHSKVLLKLNLEESAQKKMVVPVEVVNAPGGMTVKTFPSVVEVEVSAPYNLFDSLVPSAISVKVDMNSPEKGSGKLRVKAFIKNPEMRVVKCVPDKVEYILRKK